MDNYIGTRLDGRYQVDALVGEGGMADVYRGTDLLENRTVAIKLLRDEFYTNEELVRRFKNESRAISVLNHGNIVKVYDVSVDDRIHYMVMEYIDGITLKEYIEQRGEPLTYRETVHFITQILKALQHAHDKGIVHRDIKPQNIMIVEDGTIKVMDFGIARLARSENHATSEQAIGSVHYISPEQAKGESTDARADIYSAGVMMYEMLTGQLPFESEDLVAIAMKHISEEAPLVKQVNPAAPEGLSEITAKAMAKEPRSRYQNTMEMLRDIEEFKRNPSIRFEYEYLSNDAPTRYIDKVVSNSKRPVPNGKAGARRNGKTKRKRRVGLMVPIIIGLTLAVVGACILLSWNLLMNSGNPLFTDYDDIELPDFVGMQYSEVEALLKKEQYKYLRLETPKQVSNLKVPAGQVISQNPTSNNNNKKKVKANQRLYLTVSLGVQDVTIPDLSGMSRAEAVKLVKEMGLRPYAKTVVDSTVPEGRVIGTQPAAGQTLRNDGDAVLVINVSGIRSSGEDILVPNLIGLTSSNDARNVLRQIGLQLGNVTEEPNAEHAAGTVIEQTPEANSQRRMGASVHIVISSGPPEPTPEEIAAAEAAKATVPNVIGMSAAAAYETITAAGYTCNSPHNMPSTEAERGTVLRQSPDGGTKLNPGSNVGIWVGAGGQDKQPAPEPAQEEPAPDPVVPEPPDEPVEGVPEGGGDAG